MAEPKRRMIADDIAEPTIHPPSFITRLINLMDKDASLQRMLQGNVQNNLLNAWIGNQLKSGPFFYMVHITRHTPRPSYRHHPSRDLWDLWAIVCQPQQQIIYLANEMQVGGIVSGLNKKPFDVQLGRGDGFRVSYLFGQPAHADISPIMAQIFLIFLYSGAHPSEIRAYLKFSADREAYPSFSKLGPALLRFLIRKQIGKNQNLPCYYTINIVNNDGSAVNYDTLPVTDRYDPVSVLYRKPDISDIQLKEIRTALKKERRALFEAHAQKRQILWNTGKHRTLWTTGEKSDKHLPLQMFRDEIAPHLPHKSDVSALQRSSKTMRALRLPYTQTVDLWQLVLSHHKVHELKAEDMLGVAQKIVLIMFQTQNVTLDWHFYGEGTYDDTQYFVARQFLLSCFQIFSGRNSNVTDGPKSLKIRLSHSDSLDHDDATFYTAAIRSFHGLTHLALEIYNDATETIEDEDAVLIKQAIVDHPSLRKFNFEFDNSSDDFGTAGFVDILLSGLAERSNDLHPMVKFVLGCDITRMEYAPLIANIITKHGRSLKHIKMTVRNFQWDDDFDDQMQIFTRQIASSFLSCRSLVKLSWRTVYMQMDIPIMASVIAQNSATLTKLFLSYENDMRHGMGESAWYVIQISEAQTLVKAIAQCKLLQQLSLDRLQTQTDVDEDALVLSETNRLIVGMVQNLKKLEYLDLELCDLSERTGISILEHVENSQFKLVRFHIARLPETVVVRRKKREVWTRAATLKGLDLNLNFQDKDIFVQSDE